MNTLKLKLTDSKYGFGFISFRNTGITVPQFDKIKIALIKAFDIIIDEVLK